MYRNLEEKLKIWKNDKFRKPLLLSGARQVGKTYLIENIFSKEFKRFLKVDFRKDKSSRCFVKNNQNPKDIIEYLSLRYNQIIDKDTLLFFDEGQECIQILTSLKYFAQDFKEIPVIVSGSYVRLKLHQMEYEEGNNKIIFDPEINKENQDGHNNFLFPVGKIDELNLSIMTFDEFLFSYNETLYHYLKKSYLEKKHLDNEYHKLALDAFYTYMIIGGMPEVVDIFLTTKSSFRAQQKLETIYNNYLGDMFLYQISTSTINRTKLVFENIYEELNKTNKNFKISNIEEGKRYRDYLSSLDWLVNSQLIYPSYQLKEKISYPLLKKENSLFRVYLTDIGLFTFQSKVDVTDFLNDNKQNTLAGIYFENAFAIEAKSRGIELFYWEGKNTSEMEFILAKNEKFYPVDVKKNKGSLASLENFRNHNADDYAIKVSSKGYGFDEEKRVLNLPFYYVSFFLDEFVKPNELNVK